MAHLSNESTHRPHVAVMHASGRTGRRLAQRLLAAGHRVRALGRTAARLETLRGAQAELCIGDPLDVAFLRRAFEGVDCVYALMPYDVSQPGYLARQRQQGEAMAHALRAAGVPRVVLLSSLGAELASGTGMILSLHEQEQRLADIPWLHAVFLRAGDFMENRLAALPSMLEHRMWCDVVSPQRPVPMVATADIADAAFDVIAAPEWTGLNVREVLGPCDISFDEVTRILAHRLDLPGLRYEACSAAAMRDLLAGAGLPEDVAALMAQIGEGIEEGRIRSRFGRGPQGKTGTIGTMGTMGTRFADFAHVIELPAVA